MFVLGWSGTFAQILKMKVFFRGNSNLMLVLSVLVIVLLCWPFAAYLVYCVDEDLFYALPFFSLLGLAVVIHGVPLLLNWFVVRWIVGILGFGRSGLGVDLLFLSTLFTSVMLYLTVLFFLFGLSVSAILGLILAAEGIGFLVIGRNRALWMED